MEHPRTTSARDHDDHDIIDQAVADADSGAVGSSAGGREQVDVGSKADLLDAVDDPEGTRRPEKQDAIDSGQAHPAGRGNNRQ